MPGNSPPTKTLTNEELRLRELAKYEILFSRPEKAFDRIAELARRLFNVPIALITFIDRDVQWFKSCIGMPGSETSRQVSFCTHAIESDKVTVVPNAAVDARFSNNPHVIGDPGIRFYAGAPLINESGFRLGTVCIIDLQPRPEGLNADQQKTLGDLAAMAVSELELRLAMKTNLETMRQLARSNDDLDRFAQVCSHDLKAPARTANQFVQLFLSRAGDTLGGESREYLQIVLDNTSRMMRVVDDVLKHSKAIHAAADSDFRPIDANRIVESAVGNLAGIIRDTGAGVTSDSLPAVPGNSHSLLQVFQNLIANAIHYRSVAPPRIHISCRTESDENIFCVADNGIGIEPAHCQVIFEPFKRLHGEEKPGTGIGLYTCQSIVHRAGGRIWVESKVGEGSQFFFTLPTQTGQSA